MLTHKDIDEHFEGRDLVLVCLEIHAREDGSEPTVDEVRAFLVARRVLAGIAAGARYANPHPVVVNLAVIDEGKLLVAKDNGNVGTGQDIEEFISGLAYTLRTNISADEEVIFTAHSQEPLPIPPERPLGLERSLHVLATDSPLPAFASLFFANSNGDECDGAWSIRSDYLLIQPQQGLTSTPAITLLDEPSLPMFTFSKAGASHFVSVGTRTQENNDLTIFAGEPWDVTFSVPPSADEHCEHALINLLVSSLPPVVYADDVEELIASDSAKPTAKFHNLDLLRTISKHTTEYGALSAEDLFMRVSQLAGFPTEIQDCIRAFARTGDYRSPVTGTNSPEPALPSNRIGAKPSHNFFSVYAFTSALMSLHKEAKALHHARLRGRALGLKRFRQKINQFLPLIFFALATLYLIGGHVSGSSLGIDLTQTKHTVWLWGIWGLNAVWFVVSAPTLIVMGRARHLLHKAHVDGAYPYNV